MENSSRKLTGKNIEYIKNIFRKLPIIKHLAYELEIHEKLKDKTLAIIEPRKEYKRDKTWSFWKVAPHNFDDCVKKNWENFSVNIPGKTNYLECKNFPYQSVDSGLFYEKIKNKLKRNENIFFFKNID